jgi:DNA-directed RNA polymerase subunit RPC12/RpoP
MVNIRDLIDEARCYQPVREMRWPDRILCPHCSSESVIKDGRDDTQSHRQRYLCHGCQRRFDDLTGTNLRGSSPAPADLDSLPRLHGTEPVELDDDGDGFCETHVNTLEGFWSLLRSWQRPHRRISQEKLPLYLAFFEFIHNVRARDKSVLGSLIGLLIAPPCNPS